jgi:hypothetical protein
VRIQGVAVNLPYCGMVVLAVYNDRQDGRITPAAAAAANYDDNDDNDKQDKMMTTRCQGADDHDGTDDHDGANDRDGADDRDDCVRT